MNNTPPMPGDEDKRVAADLAYNEAKNSGVFERQRERRAIEKELQLIHQQNFCGTIDPLQ